MKVLEGRMLGCRATKGLVRVMPLVAGLLIAAVVAPSFATAQGPQPTITEFPLPTAASLPFGIAPGPDGALWFAEFASARIGRITTAGMISEFPLLGSRPIYIAA